MNYKSFDLYSRVYGSKILIIIINLLIRTLAIHTLHTHMKNLHADINYNHKNFKSNYFNAYTPYSDEVHAYECKIILSKINKHQKIDDLKGLFSSIIERASK